MQNENLKPNSTPGNETQKSENSSTTTTNENANVSEGTSTTESQKSTTPSMESLLSTLQEQNALMLKLLQTQKDEVKPITFVAPQASTSGPSEYQLLKTQFEQMKNGNYQNMAFKGYVIDQSFRGKNLLDAYAEFHNDHKSFEEIFGNE